MTKINNEKILDSGVIELLNTPLSAKDFELMERQVGGALDLYNTHSKLGIENALDEDFLLAVSMFIYRAKKSLNLEDTQ